MRWTRFSWGAHSRIATWPARLPRTWERRHYWWMWQHSRTFQSGQGKRRTWILTASFKHVLTLNFLTARSWCSIRSRSSCRRFGQCKRWRSRRCSHQIPRFIDRTWRTKEYNWPWSRYSWESWRFGTHHTSRFKENWQCWRTYCMRRYWHIVNILYKLFCIYYTFCILYVQLIILRFLIAIHFYSLFLFRRSCKNNFRFYFFLI